MLFDNKDADAHLLNSYNLPFINLLAWWGNSRGCIFAHGTQTQELLTAINTSAPPFSSLRGGKETKMKVCVLSN
jgi:hypothetical protein